MSEQIRANKRKALLLTAVFALPLLILGLLANLLFGGGLVGVAITVIVVAAVTIVADLNSERIALRLVHAVPADPEQHARFDNLVESLCIGSGIPQPSLYVVVDDAPNTFSIGLSPKRAAIVATTGLLDKLSRIELEGVVAHELSHIRNYDVLPMTLAVTMVGTGVVVSDAFLRVGGDGPLAPVFAIPARMTASVMRLSVNRDREYVADASGVQLTRYPPGLISAFKKMEGDPATQRASKASAHLWIEEPDGGSGHGKWSHVLDTHPPLEDRIHALEEL